jgi:hypothetical protein
MERVRGIGGYVLRAAGPAARSAQYRDCLGLDADENGRGQGAGLDMEGVGRPGWVTDPEGNRAGLGRPA